MLVSPFTTCTSLFSFHVVDRHIKFFPHRKSEFRSHGVVDCKLTSQPYYNVSFGNRIFFNATVVEILACYDKALNVAEDLLRVQFLIHLFFDALWST